MEIISKVLNNCHLRRKAERERATLKAHQREEDGGAGRMNPPRFFLQTGECLERNSPPHTSAVSCSPAPTSLLAGGARLAETRGAEPLRVG